MIPRLVGLFLLPLMTAVSASAGHWRIVDIKAEQSPENDGVWLKSAAPSGSGVIFSIQLSPSSSHEDRGQSFRSKGGWSIPPAALTPGQRLSFQIDLSADKVELGGHWHLKHGLSLSAWPVKPTPPGSTVGGVTTIASTEIGTSSGAPKTNRASGEWTVPQGSSSSGGLWLTADGSPGRFRVTYTYRWMEGEAPPAGNATTTGVPSGTPSGNASGGTGTAGTAPGGTSITYDDAGQSIGDFSGPEVELFRNGNDSSVSNGGKDAWFALSRPARITSILTYHYNNGQGAPGGTIRIVSEAGSSWGPWRAEGARSAHWVVRPGVSLPAGRYRVVDSDPATWSSNSGSRGQGHIILKGQWSR